VPNFTTNKNRVFQGETVINFFPYSLWIKINPSSCENCKERGGFVRVLHLFCCNVWNTLFPIFKVKGIPNANLVQFRI